MALLVAASDWLWQRCHCYLLYLFWHPAAWQHNKCLFEGISLNGKWRWHPVPLIASAECSVAIDSLTSPLFSSMYQLLICPSFSERHLFSGQMILLLDCSEGHHIDNFFGIKKNFNISMIAFGSKRENVWKVLQLTHCWDDKDTVLHGTSQTDI